MTELDVILGRSLRRIIMRYGVYVDALRYQSQELGQLCRRLRKPGKEYPVVDVIAPPDNLGHIYVTDPETGLHLRVPATNQEYTSDLSRDAHMVNLQCAKKYRNSCTDKHALTEAKSRILGLILEDVPINKTVARYIENHNNYSNMVDSQAGNGTKPGPVKPPKRPNNKTARKA
jgi:hypothetical protein